MASLDQSLTRMGLDYVDIFYSHRFDPDTPLEETIGALDHAVRVGKALYAGRFTLPEALAAVSSSGGWRVAELAALDPDEAHYLHFEYQLDARQLPSPMQIDLGGRGDWALHVERELALALAP